MQVTISLRLTGDHSQDRLLRALQELSADTGIETSISWPDPATSITGTVRADGPVPPVIPPPPAAPPHGRIGIRPAPRVVTVDDTPLDLSRLEYELLLFLAEHPARVFTRLQLLNHVWGHTHAGLRTVDVHVRRLRAKFGDEVPLLTTVHGVGYRLADAATIDIAPD
ncbi:winged helix-turn-helix domain-containing protein [Micromonospora sp. NBC_01813]|nr:winged helix-turn-helix domain-containing protein [Micromonospora sp. NBC_01813]WSA12915.1 winged helix-turn-helix domain-containing protein [Micromonospora sp. NBC_01813]